MDRTTQSAPASLQPSAEFVASGPAAPRIGIIYNPRSHRNQGQDLACTRRDGIMVAEPNGRAEIADALAGFAASGIDYLIINGGDGTVRDVLTMGRQVFGAQWPQLAVLPKGKTNALNVDLGAPADWTVEGAIAAFATGRRVVRRPLVIRGARQAGPPITGFILGAGAFTLGTQAGQDAHRIGFFNSLAVASTAVWGMAQAFFGTDANRWRRGTAMAVRIEPGGTPLPHSDHGDPARRSLLFATTLERMPVGVRPFGKLRYGLKLVVMDKPLRRLLASSPAILAGMEPRWLARAGYYQLAPEAFSFTLTDDAVIVDGEAFPPDSYSVEPGPELTFVAA